MTLYREGNMELTNAQHTQTKQSESTGLDTTQTHNKIATQSNMSQPTETVVSAVLATPELLVMVLSQLDIRDLTRALSVSRYWYQTILGAIELRRTLFLAPKDSADEYLEWKRGRLEWEPFIVHEPTSGTRPIVKPHPVLIPAPHPRTYLAMAQRYRGFRSVSPSAFLTQPPVSECTIRHVFPIFSRKSEYELVIKRARGVTFGDVVEELAAHHAHSDGRLLRANGDLEDICGGEEDDFVSASYWEACKPSLDQNITRIEAAGVVAEASDWVRAARERLEQ